MGWDTARQKVLAENVANADTPHFRASDLRPLDFGAELRSAAAGTGATPQLAAAITSPLDVGFSTQGDSYDPVVDTTAPDREINGNTVSLEDELMQVSETASDYQLMTNLYKKQINLFTDALDKGA
jgi:flagellar basal-body rod protein FlgB